MTQKLTKAFGPWAIVTGASSGNRNQPLYIPGFLNKVMAGLMGRKLLPRQASVALWGTIMKRGTPQSLRL